VGVVHALGHRPGLLSFSALQPAHVLGNLSCAAHFDHRFFHGAAGVCVGATHQPLANPVMHSSPQTVAFLWPSAGAAVGGVQGAAAADAARAEGRRHGGGRAGAQRPAAAAAAADWPLRLQLLLAVSLCPLLHGDDDNYDVFACSESDLSVRNNASDGHVLLRDRLCACVAVLHMTLSVA